MDRTEKGRAEDWEALSLLLEQATGADSIPTIQSHYATDTGSFRCVWPGCKFTRHDPYDMWRHVHFGHPGAETYARPDPFQGLTTYDELSALAARLWASE